MRITNDKWPLRYTWKFFYFTVIWGGLFVLLLRYYSTSYSAIRDFIYNSDALYLPSLYVDVLNGENISEWRLPPTPYFFPDMLLYFLLMTVTSSMHVTVVVLGMIQFLVFTLGLFLLARETMPRSYGLGRYGLVVLMGGLFLIFSDKLMFYSQMIFISAHHFGIVLIIPFVLTLVCKLISKLKMPLVYILCILSFLTGLSDALFLIQVAVPLAGSLVVLLLIKQSSVKHTFTIVSAMLIPGVIAWALNYFVITGKNSLVKSYLFRPHLMGPSMLTFFKSLLASVKMYPIHAILAGGLLSGCVLVLVIQWRQFRTAFKSKSALLLASYFLFALVINVVAILLFGVFMDRNGFRYFLPFLIFPAFWGMPFVLRVPKIVSRRVFAGAILAIYTIIVLFSLQNIEHQQIEEIFTDAYYPSYIRCIDEKATQVGIKHGIAQYWQARPISMLTQNELKVVQVNRDLSPFYWINNLAWYEIEPEFVVIDLSLPKDHKLRLDEDLIRKRFGDPDAVFQCEQALVMVYSRPDNNFAALCANIP